METALDYPVTTHCGCNRCRREYEAKLSLTAMQSLLYGSVMVLCSQCGNKRCPHAEDHRNECTASNEPGQAGSRY